MNIKNYTSEVPVSRTLARIQELLISAGVSRFSMDFDPFGKITAVVFSLQIAADKSPIPIRVPANVDGCQDALWRDYCGQDREFQMQNGDFYCAGSRKQKKKSSFKDQAERTAWKLMQDWLEVQLSLIALNQAEFMQVFLPYVWDQRSGATFFQRLKQNDFTGLMLTDGSQS